MLTFWDLDPQTIHLPDSPQSNPRSWSEPRTFPDRQLYVVSGSAANMYRIERDDSDTIEYPTSFNYVDQMDPLSSPMTSNPRPYIPTEEPIPVMEQETTEGSTHCSVHELIDHGLGIIAIPNAPFNTEELREREPQ